MLALRVVLVALLIGLLVHVAIWFWVGGQAIEKTLRPDVLLHLLGPALLPTAVIALFLAVSDRFNKWRWVVGLSVIAFIFEQAVFWAWSTTLVKSMGFEVLYMMPIMGGLPLALSSYAAAQRWTER